MSETPPGIFREPFNFANSAAGIARFPYPFDRDSFMYSVNIRPHRPGPAGSATEFPFDVDEHYRAELAERAYVLAGDPVRSAALPHMRLHQWDALELIMTSLAAAYPDRFQLDRRGDRWHWTNRVLGTAQSFGFGQDETLEAPPLATIARQMQGDFVLLDQRDGDLYADAGVVTGPADWSLAFILGMSFKQWHAPVPLADELGVFDRALRYLLKLRHGEPVRRLNWTISARPRLDTSPETYPEWRPLRALVDRENVGSWLHLRVELQSLFRLPRSNGILFSIRTYLVSFDDLATNPIWATRLARVLASLPAELVAYKGLALYLEPAIAWLNRFA